jgi:hypothetical protein
MVRKWLGAFFLGLCAMVTATAIPVPHRPRAAAQPVEVVSLHEAMCPDCVAQVRVVRGCIGALFSCEAWSF